MHFLVRPHTGASNLSFFLVMPVQRITKYPLLLQKIVENTSDTDSAYGALQAAASTMTDVNANINEYKRRKEIGKGDRSFWLRLLQNARNLQLPIALNPPSIICLKTVKRYIWSGSSESDYVECLVYFCRTL